MYQPHLARKFKLQLFRMEIDRKNGAVLMSMVLEQFSKFIIKKKKSFCQIIFSPKNSFKCISPIAAAAAAAAAAAMHHGSYIYMLDHAYA